MGNTKSGLYDREDFEKNLIPTHLKSDVRELIEVAVAVGWKFHRTTGTGCSLIAPGDPSPKRLHFGATRATRSNRNMMKDIVKYSDKTLLMLVMNSRNLPDSYLAYVPTIEETAIDDRPQPTETRSRPVPKAPPSAPEPVTSESEVKPTDVVKADVHIVSESPMLAKAREGEGYLSPTTIERRWSDGSKDYICAYLGCDYTHADRASVPRHYGRSHSEGLTAPPASFRAEVPESTPYAPQQRRVDALAEALRLLDGEVDMGNWEDLKRVAREALTWVNDQTRRKTDLSVEREPMSSDEMLERIRSMLDQGQYLGLQHQITEREEQIDLLARKVTEMEGRWSHEHDRADKLQSHLDGLRELLTELKDSDVKEAG
jgi:hypothetical protein